MALESQLRGEKFCNVIKEDYKSFCDKLIAVSDKKSTKEKILNYLFISIITVGVMLILEIIIYLNTYSKDTLKFQMPLTWSFVLSTLLIIIAGNVTLTYIAKNSFEFSGENSGRTTNIFGILFITVFCIIGLTKYFFRNIAICNINYLIFLIILLVALIAIKAFEK